MSVTAIPPRASAVLTIDVDAVAANWRLCRDRALPARCAAVVKADAYGLGAERIAPALAAEGCREFFVATIDEGIGLRRILPESAIFVLCGPLAGAEGDLVGHRLVPVLNSLEQIGLWRDAAARHGAALAAAIHADSGMTRLGLEAREVGALTADPALLAGIRPVLALSHLACADDRSAAMNGAQRDLFTRLAASLPEGMPRSLAASSGIFLGAAYHLDMVRPGSALYGINPTPGHSNPMRPAVRLEARILQVRDVDTPMTVGYGATHQIARKGRVATVAVGYADGWLRSLGNRGHGVIEGVRVPVVGRISMDLTTFDVSALPADTVRPGAMIELIGPSHDADAVAAEAGTIGYEILTALGRRYARVHVGGAA
ncbi:MAG: alanine racemase [Magnetospirillum sp.]|nr:alanine racemase [Magnetospirillum sp.]